MVFSLPQRISSATLAAAALALPCAVTAAEHRIDCPAELPAAAVQVVNPPAGWIGSVPDNMRLRSIDVLSSPPEGRQVLKADTYVKRAGKSTEKWMNLNDLHAPDGKWIACNYGEGNDVVLSKRLDQRTSECRATYTKDKQGGAVVEALCKW